MRGRVGAALLAIVVVLGGYYLQTVLFGSPSPPPDEWRQGRERSYGSHGAGIDADGATGESGGREVASGEGEGSASTGRFVISVVGSLGEPVAGAPVGVRGPEAFSLATDEEGTAGFAGPPGEYTVRIPAGCSGDIHVLRGGGGRAGVAPGKTGRATIEIERQRRIGPAPPVFSSRVPDWPVGEGVRVRFDVVDRCTGTRAPRADLGTVGVVTGDILALTEEPPARADPDGYGWLDLICLEEGVIALKVVDETNPTDRLDLGAHLGGPACVR